MVPRGRFLLQRGFAASDSHLAAHRHCGRHDGLPVGDALPRFGEIRVQNFGAQAVEIELQADVARWDWDDRSMHFHANWRPDDVVPGTPFQDWNFIDIRGQGVFVGDAWTVLNFAGQLVG